MTGVIVGMREIQLTQGQVALVDDQDYEYLNQWKWCAIWSDHTRSFYAMRVSCDRGQRVTIQMHRLILGITDPRIKVDHRDSNTLNNQWLNLRVCNNRQNQQNTRKRSNCSSQYKGVSWDRKTSRWKSQIQIPSESAVGTKVHLGYFNLEVDAAYAYNEAAHKHFGEFAHLNRIEEG